MLDLDFERGFFLLRICYHLLMKNEKKPKHNSFFEEKKRSEAKKNKKSNYIATLSNIFRWQNCICTISPLSVDDVFVLNSVLCQHIKLDAGIDFAFIRKKSVEIAFECLF